MLGPESLPPALRGEQPRPAPGAERGGRSATGFSLERHLDEAERRYLLAALKRAERGEDAAAELLGLTFRSLPLPAGQARSGRRWEEGDPSR